jgi:hypothetical protein
MKKLLLILVLGMFLACAGEPEENYEVREWDDGTKVAVIKDEDGSEILMDYILFTHLMNSGSSYREVREYHHHHYRNSPDYKNKVDRVKQTSTTYKPKYSQRQTVKRAVKSDPVKPSAKPTAAKPSTTVKPATKSTKSNPTRKSGK